MPNSVINDPAAVLPSTGFRRRWTLALVVGEFVGFVPPAVTGAALAASGVGDLMLVIGLTVAGLCEGATIGFAQARVLARDAPSVDGRAWVAATVIAAGFAWLVGMGGGALMGSEIVAPEVLLVVLVPAWIAALLAMGALQWRVLQRTVPDSGIWVPVSAAAWLLGIMIPVISLSVAPNSWPLWAHVAVGVIGATAMGLTVGALTGRSLERLLRHRVHHRSDERSSEPLRSTRAGK